MNVVLLVFLIGSDVTEWKVFDDVAVFDDTEVPCTAVLTDSLFFAAVSMLIYSNSIASSHRNTSYV